MSELIELISLTKQHLLSEYSQKEWKFCDEETYRFFKARAKTAATSPVPKKVIEPIVVKEKAPPLPVKEPVQEVVIVEEVKPIVKTEYNDFDEIKRVLQIRFPSFALLSTPPDDSESKKITEIKPAATQVVILNYDKQTPPFLKNLAFAIEQELATCQILSAPRLESEKGWDNLLRQTGLKLILTTDYGLFSMPGGMQTFREIPKQAKSFLGNIPLLLLTDLSLYLNEPKLKPTLWRAICQMIK